MVALCQRGQASCGACCGLYNRADLSRAAVEQALEARTRALAGVDRTPAAYRAAAAALATPSGAAVFESVRVCPLLGYVDPDTRRIGCLAHPAVTGGQDLRACGVYDVLTCDAFLCPSHAFLTEEDAELAEGAAADFYLYGLVVTDAPFLRTVLAAVAARVGSPVRPGHLAHPPFRTALGALLALKESLEPGSDGLFGAFHPARRAGAIAGDEGEGEPAGAVEIVAALGADARSGNDEDALEAEAARRLGACVGAFPRHLRIAARPAHGSG